MKKLISLLLLTPFYFLLAGSASAACDFHQSMTPGDKNVIWANTCTISSVEGIDAAADETSTTNSAALTLDSGSSITINNGGKLIVGSLNLGGGTVAIQDGGQIKPGSPIYVSDSDGDGYASLSTFYDSTSSGRRRLSFIKDYTTSDCSDSSYSTINQCLRPYPVLYGYGTDGDVTFTTNTNLSTTNVASGRSCADGGEMVAYSVTGISGNDVTLASSPSSGCLSLDDEVVVINLQGTSTYQSNVGKYETAIVHGVSGNVITLSEITENFGNGNDQTNIGTSTSNQRVMLQRVPNYQTATVNAGATIYTNGWNGTKGGLFMMKSKASITVNSTGIITMYGRGYRGGNAYWGGESICGTNGGGTSTSNPGGGVNGGNGTCGGGGGGPGDGVDPTGNRSGGSGGGSYGGAGGAGGSADGGDTRKNSAGGGGGGGGAGSAGAGGGAGTGYTTGNPGNNGGTGTSGAGGEGIGTGTHVAEGAGGGGGGKYNLATLFTNRLFMGSGGGGGGWGENGAPDNAGTAGGTGGGIIYLASKYITMYATNAIYAHGAPGTNNSLVYAGSGGGGGGGTIYLETNTATLSNSGVLATGSSGGTVNTGGGQGGTGGNGIIGLRYYVTYSGSTNPTFTSF